MRRLTRLALGAGAVLGLSAWVAPCRRSRRAPARDHISEKVAITPSSSRPTTPPATRSSPMTGPTTAA